MPTQAFPPEEPPAHSPGLQPASRVILELYASMTVEGRSCRTPWVAACAADSFRPSEFDGRTLFEREIEGMKAVQFHKSLVILLNRDR